MKNWVVLLFILLIGCENSDKEREAWQGQWHAKWTTDPEGYAELKDQFSFEMNGLFHFKGEELTVAAYGYDGCIFGEDTLSHTQNWIIKGDTLELQSQSGETGIQYKILNQEANRIKLQLVDDILITLERSE